MLPLVSIITPAYNCEQYIEETILSVLNQTYTNWEHIIVNDASTDQTPCIIEKYSLLNPKIKIVSLSCNMGVANARNAGIEKASGEYIAFLDSDDQWKAHKLACHMNFILNHRLQFSYTAYEVIDKNGNHIKNITPAKLTVNYQQLLYTNVIPCCTVIIESNLMKDEKMPSIGHEDFATWLNILHKHNINAVGMPEILSTYRKTNKSVSSNKWKTIRWNWQIYRKNQKLSFFKSLKYIISYIFLTGLKYIK